ncbi:heavy-metal-associated domain-containing protein [Streptomyces sp. DH37]|uniref:heavy-metal-associated domain-containing protein n=1 Tax=Streptomyces sp. DH37 TaxID=3040122 RepID=UPI002441FFC0|nr:heavy-metal-associated domain-containing protein [Streptomyces sp. DH37]MDG9702853.1 heavy-metal-associated domain-containing protein [Streptomyces sp. DH37]
MSSCCTPGGSRSTAAARTTAAEGTTTVYAVAGMTCGHCAATLTEAVGGLDGVLSVEVDLAAGHVGVTTEGAPDDARIAEAVGEAGYELTGRAA